MPSWAQEEEAEEELGWSNSTDLGLVITDGNSSTETLSFNNLLQRLWNNSRYTMRIEAVSLSAVLSRSRSHRRKNSGWPRYAAGANDS